MQKLISANRLHDGIVVYLGRKGPWVDALDKAAILTDDGEVETALRFAQADAAMNIVLDPFVIEVLDSPAGRRPATLRDAIRATGPTVDFRAKATAELRLSHG